MLIQELLARQGLWAPADGEGNDLGGDADKGGDAGDDKDTDKKEDRGDTVEGAEDEEGDEKQAADEDENEEDDATKKGDDKKDDKAKDDKKSDKKDDKAKDDKKPYMIPKARFDDALKKEREARIAAEDKLKALTKAEGTPEKIVSEIEALEDKLDEAFADGKKDAVKDLRAQIRKKTAALNDISAAKLAQRATVSAVEQVQYSALVAALEAAHPVVNPDSKDYDEDLAAEVLDLKDAYEAKGHSSAEALEKAAKLILSGREKKADKDDAEGEEVDPAAKKIADAEKAAAERKAAAVKKGTDAAKKQPADAKDVGKDSDKHGGGTDGNATRMTDEDFDKLPEATKKRMRGDSL